MSGGPPPGRRLDSWKTIAEYLQRDVATVARWEKTLGLPVRRVAGAGRSVFADTADIDEWLRTTKPGAEPSEPAVTLPADTPPPAVPATSARKYVAASLALVIAVVAILVGLVAPGESVPAADLRIEVTATGVVARDAAGGERWRHAFPAEYRTMVLAEPSQVVGGADPGVYFGTVARELRANDRVEGGTLNFFNLDGVPQRSFSFDDEVNFNGTSYGSPWVLTSFAAQERDGRRRVAVSAHHHMWNPGLVTILDERWQRRGTFVHDGWIEQVRWLGPEQLLVGGFSNSHNGGMVALLNAAALDGQGPESAGSPRFCQNCGTGAPLRMLVFPRSELNLVTLGRFNRALVTTWSGGLVAQTREVFSTDGDATAMYEFSPSLDLVKARYNERYWDMHRGLEAAGTLTHARDQCPDRDGPREVKVWEPATGWRQVRLR
jgi:hypothetical protein